MAIRADLRHPGALEGPLPIQRTDIGALNVLFSEAFTERYRRDGLVGVRVPPLNPAIWRYAIADAEEGAMLWRDERGAIAAFNISHRSGIEGWMGPLAVREDCQGFGHGKTIVRAGIEHLQRGRCTVIGLETMPRTMDNIGFYGGLGFAPGRLTVTLTIDAGAGVPAPRTLSALPSSSREAVIAECTALAAAQIAGYDFSREIRLTHEFALGDTLLVRDGDALAGFALCHSAPLVEGRAREELRVLKLVARDEAVFAGMIPALAALARRCNTGRAALRMQGDYPRAFSAAMSAGARARWTDLRMTLTGYPERTAPGVLLSNWEI